VKSMTKMIRKAALVLAPLAILVAAFAGGYHP
jgi:hypothetical protein